MAGRSIWPPRSSDDWHCFLFGHRIADCVRAEFCDVSVVARLVRDRDGWRMGPGRVARDGIVADANARSVLGNFATGLRLRLSPGCASLLDRFSHFWLALSIFRGSVAVAARYIYSCARASVSGLGT